MSQTIDKIFKKNSTDLAKLPKDYLTFLHGNTYYELFTILDILLAGAKPEWVKKGYNPDLIFDDFLKLLQLWKKIDKVSDLNKLPLLEFNEFLDLNEEFEKKIGLWKKFREEYGKSFMLIKNAAPPILPYELPRDLDILSKRIQLTLKIYYEQNEFLFKYQNLENIYIFYYVIFDFNKGIYLYNDSPSDFQPGIDEFKFLEILLKNRGRIVTYQDVNRVLNKKIISGSNEKDIIQQVRKNLQKQLFTLTTSKERTGYMLSKITSKTNLGYILT